MFWAPHLRIEKSRPEASVPEIIDLDKLYKGEMRGSLKKTRESTDDKDTHPMTRVDDNENTTLRTHPIKKGVAEGHFSEEDKRINR